MLLYAVGHMVRALAVKPACCVTQSPLRRCFTWYQPSTPRSTQTMTSATPRAASSHANQVYR